MRSRRGTGALDGEPLPAVDSYIHVGQFLERVNLLHAGNGLRSHGLRDAVDASFVADFVLLLKQQPSEAAARFRTVAWTLVRLDAQSRTPDLSPPVRDELQEAWAVVLWLADFLHDNEERLRRVH